MKRGFTLIELLVVIAIISLLSSITLATFDGVRENARNTKRSVTIKEYVTALELVFDDINGYPRTPSASVFDAFCLGQYSGGESCYHTTIPITSNTTFNNLLAPYLPGLPRIEHRPVSDPNWHGGFYQCMQETNNRCRQYRIFWIMEGSSNCAGGQVFFDRGAWTLCAFNRGI